MSKLADFSKLDTSVVPAAKPAAAKKTGTGGLREGKYQDVVIVKIEEDVKCKSDPTWYWVNFHLQKDDRWIRDRVAVPTQRLTYGPEASGWAYEGLIRFLSLLGIVANQETVGEIIPKVFGHNMQKAVGMKMDIEVGYSQVHGGSFGRAIALYTRDGKLVEDETGKPITFQDYAAAESYCRSRKMEFQKWPEVRRKYAPVVPNDPTALLADPEPEVEPTIVDIDDFVVPTEEDATEEIGNASLDDVDDLPF